MSKLKNKDQLFKFQIKNLKKKNPAKNKKFEIEIE